VHEHCIRFRLWLHSPSYREEAVRSNNQTGTLVAPTLDLSGTLSYASGANSVTGALTAPAGLTGTANAHFYGPAAAELAGAFFVGDGANTKQMTGSFGVKR